MLQCHFVINIKMLMNNKIIEKIKQCLITEEVMTKDRKKNRYLLGENK